MVHHLRRGLYSRWSEWTGLCRPSPGHTTDDSRCPFPDAGWFPPHWPLLFVEQMRWRLLIAAPNMLRWIMKTDWEDIFNRKVLNCHERRNWRHFIFASFTDVIIQSSFIKFIFFFLIVENFFQETWSLYGCTSSLQLNIPSYCRILVFRALNWDFWNQKKVQRPTWVSFKPGRVTQLCKADLGEYYATK